MQQQLHDIDTKLAVTCREVKQNKEDIDDLQRKSNVNDIVGAVVAGIVGSLFGGNR